MFLPAWLCRYNLNRIFFGGFFIRGHPYTMETISFAIRFWSKARLLSGSFILWSVDVKGALASVFQCSTWKCLCFDV